MHSTLAVQKSDALMLKAEEANAGIRNFGRQMHGIWQHRGILS